MSDQFQQPKEISIKIITICPATVGKTSLLRRLAQDSFSENPLTTLGIDFFIKRMCMKLTYETVTLGHSRVGMILETKFKVILQSSTWNILCI